VSTHPNRTTRPARRTLRSLAVVTAAVGALVLPGTAAFADSGSPSPSPVRPGDARLIPCPEDPSKKTKDAKDRRAVAECERRVVLGGDGKGTVVPGTRTVPRGGVAAGEQPAARGGSDSTALVAGGTAAGLGAGLAGFVLLRRRRSAGQNA
jgi:hypothetical protein